MTPRSQSVRYSHRSPNRRWELSDRTKKIVIISMASGVVLVGGIWAFDVLVAPAKPDLRVAGPEQVTEYLAHSRGFARLPVDKREEFLFNIVQTYNTPERVDSMSRALRQMSFAERQQFLDATFEIGKEKFVKASEEYVRTPREKRPKYLDDVIRNFDTMRTRLSGPAPAGGGMPRPAQGVGPAPSLAQHNLASPFRDHIPTKSDAFTKMIVDRTSPSERAKAKPLVDDLSQRMDQLRRQANAGQTGARKNG